MFVSEALRQVSALDVKGLIGTAEFGIGLAPEQIASRFGLSVERLFDEFGYFEFLAFEVGEGAVGFRRYTAKPTDYSYVSCVGIARDEAETFIRTQLGVDDFVAFDGLW